MLRKMKSYIVVLGFAAMVNGAQKGHPYPYIGQRRSDTYDNYQYSNQENEENSLTTPAFVFSAAGVSVSLYTMLLLLVGSIF